MTGSCPLIGAFLPEGGKNFPVLLVVGGQM